MRNAWRGSRSLAVLLLLVSAAACGGGDAAEQDGAENDTLTAGPDPTGDPQLAGDETLFAALDDPEGALDCTPPGRDEPGTEATVEQSAGEIINNPSAQGAVRPSRIGYKQHNGAQPRTDSLREVATTYPASETTIPPGRLTSPEQGYSGCAEWEGTLTLYYSVNGNNWKIWSRDGATLEARDSVFVGAEEPEQPFSGSDTTGVDIRAVKTRFALGTS